MKTELVYGLHSVQALLKSAPQRIRKLMLLNGRDDQKLQKIVSFAEREAIPLERWSRPKLDGLVEDGNHQGVVAECDRGELHDEAFLFKLLEGLDVAPFLLVLDGITDPHNLGACLRSAEAAGVHAVIVPKDNSASLTGVARKVACGAAEVLPLIPVTNLARTLNKLRDQGIWFQGAAGEAIINLYQADLKGPLGIVMGAEGDGLRRLTRETCDGLISIPMAGEVSSLNVSVATGICLFEAVRQRVKSS